MRWLLLLVAVEFYGCESCDWKNWKDPKPTGRVLGSVTISNDLTNALRVTHDDVRGVTCWNTYQGGLSCLPDREVQQ